MDSIPVTIGAYKLEREIGRGAMGVVYLAQDEKLSRPAAIKTLPPELVSYPERLARFGSEARLLASLSHGNIASVYGLEEVDGQAFLALEYVDGETLEARLQRGPIALEDALTIALQIARGIEAAHERGVIHRDLKPANIKIGSDGLVKVLDFGLARALDQVAENIERNDDETTTLATGNSTLPGMIVGTPGYMSPEQAKGERVDARTDIWAFGCLLFEMLTGSSPFTGDSASERLASTLHHDPDWEGLPRDTPAHIQRLLRRALTRDPRQRLQAIGDARLDLEEASLGSSAGAGSLTTPARASSSQTWVPWVVASVLAIAAVALIVGNRNGPIPSTTPLERTEISLPAGTFIEWEGTDTSLSKIGYSRLIALSPDGSRLICAAQSEDRTLLYLKETDGFGFEPVRGTDFARAPFFSPDGNWIGFIAGGVVKKVRLPGGPAVQVCPVMSAAFDATWTEDGSIIYSTDRGLWRVSADGGEPENLTEPDQSRDESGHHFPHILPDQRSVLFTISTNSGAHAAVLSLSDRSWRIVLRNAIDARYLDSGHIVFSRQKTIHAASFDPAAPDSVGGPVPIASGVHTTSGLGGTTVNHFATSQSDSLAYVPNVGPAESDTLLWVDHEGYETPIMSAPGTLMHPRLSPDGQRILLDMQTADGMRDLYIYEIDRGQMRRMTEDGQSFNSDWTRDGEFILTCTGDPPGKAILAIASDFSGERRTILPGEPGRYPHLSDMSPDGRTILFWDRIAGGTWEINLDGETESREFLNSSLDERWAEISPDGELIAYVGTQSGRREVFVQAYPDLGPRIQVSVHGGGEPLWSRDGTMLFFRENDALFASEISRDPEIDAGPPRLLFSGEYDAAPVGHAHYEISMDDLQFLLVKHGDIRHPRRIRMIENGIANLAAEADSR